MESAINKLYDALEFKNDIEALSVDMVTMQDADDEQKFASCIEYNVYLKIDKTDIQHRFEPYKEGVISYLNQRVKQTTNPFLLSRYYHFLYAISNDNRYFHNAIIYYQQILNQYLLAPNENANSFHFKDVLKIIVNFVENTKYKIKEFKGQILGYITCADIPFRIKTYILQILKDHTIYNASELCEIPQICIDIAEHETEYRWVEINLELGLYFAKKNVQTRNLVPLIYERLGDNEYKSVMAYDGKPENIVIPHYNQNAYKRMMEYYKLSKNREKLITATTQYNANKKNLKLLKISNKTDRDSMSVKLLNELFGSLIKSSTENIIANLCFGNFFPFIPADKINEIAKEHEKGSTALQLFSPVHIDINNNAQKVDIFSHCKFDIYHNIMSQTTIVFIIDSTLTSIANKKLTYSKVANFLKKKTLFGERWEIVRINESAISYSWLDQIDFALKDFFKQCTRHINSESTDWRIPVDILSLKFEGILRDIIDIHSGAITKVDAQGDTSCMLLDDLLRTSSFNTIFNDDDKNLFLYTFTDKGLNIRNNVAHSFYKPQDYTLNKAMLVVICIFRLVKFIPTKDRV